MRLSILFLKNFFNILFALTPIWGILALIISCLGIFIGTVEGYDWNEGFYFGWITATTVGYGDIVPTRPLTRTLSIAVSIIGIINTGLIVAIAVSAGKYAIEKLGLLEDIQNKFKRKK